MEEVNEGVEGTHLPAIVSQSQTEATLDIIRTETVLSRLPVHNLAKKGKVNIQIIKTTATGEVELKWEVSYSDRYGQARQLAYKLDTIVINQRIDEAGRPLPRILRIGSLNEICAELNISTHAGQNTKALKRAFLQNASAFITAKFTYTANDKTERHIEAGITRYGVIFTGEKLPDGRKADAVYITFNDPFWEVLNNAPVRPLDRAYMRELPPAAQRLYEIVSRKIFAALKNNYPHAKLLYSEYCTFSAQLRHYERQRVQDQMAKVLRHHKESGYITAVRYEPTIDAENKPDWKLYLTPGPKAWAEFEAAHARRSSRKNRDEGNLTPQEHRRSRGQGTVAVSAPRQPQTTWDPAVVAPFTTRGITEKKARELLSNLKPGQDALAQLEFADHLITNARVPIVNPPGFYVRLVASNTAVPDNFETSGKRKVREDHERKERERRAQEDARQQVEWEYEAYRQRETDRSIQANPQAFEEMKNARWREARERYQTFSDEMVTSIASQEAKRDIGRLAPILSFDEFKAQWEQGSAPLAKPAAPPISELAAERFDEPRATIPQNSGDPVLEPRPADEPPAMMSVDPVMPVEGNRDADPTKTLPEPPPMPSGNGIEPQAL